MDNLDNKSEKDSTLELNKTDESSVSQNQEEQEQEVPKEVPSSVNNELSSSHQSAAKKTISSADQLQQKKLTTQLQRRGWSCKWCTSTLTHQPLTKFRGM